MLYKQKGLNQRVAEASVVHISISSYLNLHYKSRPSRPITTEDP